MKAQQTISLAVGALAAVGFGQTARADFPDAFNEAPNGWTGPEFELSQSYPATRPRLERATRARWRNFDFTDPDEAPLYMRAVVDYCLEGNRERDFDDIGNNPVRKWFHTPWLHPGAGGREFIHGMTRERPSRPTELGPAQTTQVDNWAVGFYNARGGHTIGQVWANETQPDPRKAVFAPHTVTCKLLFTRATVTQAPYLDGSLEWQADVNHSSGLAQRPTLRLLQIDIAVKDPRANSTTGWVFGTYQFHTDFSPSTDWWQDLMPVGLMWGNDVAKVVANQTPAQQWINPSRLPPVLHLGFRGLLNGPVDNPQASCTGCHGFAQVRRVNNPQPSIPSPFGPNATPTNAQIQNYFQQIGPAAPLSGDYVSTDYSLQLQIGIRNALRDGGATLPANLNGPFLTARPVATSIEAVGRDGVEE